MRNPVHRETARLMTQMRRLCTLTLNKRLAAVGCSVHEYAVLFRLASEPQLTQHELASDAAIDPAAISRLVRAMARSGLVTTHVAPSDKRQRFVRLTAKGRTLERTLAPVVDDALAPMLSGLNAVEQRQFISLLRKAYQHALAQGIAEPEALRVVRRTRAAAPARRCRRRAGSPLRGE